MPTINRKRMNRYELAEFLTKVSNMAALAASNMTTSKVPYREVESLAKTAGASLNRLLNLMKD